VLLPADGVCAQYPPEVVCLQSLAELRL
jgi:hypothetical protein